MLQLSCYHLHHSVSFKDPLDEPFLLWSLFLNTLKQYLCACMWPLKHAIKSAFYEENFTCMHSVHSGMVGRCFVDLKTWIKKSLMTLFTYYVYILLLLLVGFVNSHLQTFPSLLLPPSFLFLCPCTAVSTSTLLVNSTIGSHSFLMIHIFDLKILHRIPFLTYLSMVGNSTRSTLPCGPPVAGFLFTF